MSEDEALAEARRALGPAASLRVFDPKLGEPGPPLEEPIATIIRERDEALAALRRCHDASDNGYRHDRIMACDEAAQVYAAITIARGVSHDER